MGGRWREEALGWVTVGRNQPSQFSWGWTNTLDHDFVVAKNMCFGVWEWHLCLHWGVGAGRVLQPISELAQAISNMLLPKFVLGQGPCTGSKVDAWSSALEMQLLEICE